jgi:2-polyprenyl-3-methyl-5-hydroxy-6-metoxy-1,4-benzoquinol methylase
MYKNQNYEESFEVQQHVEKGEHYSAKQKRRFLNDTKDLKINKGRLLDVGCGAGFFLKSMEDRYSEVRGVEISTSHAEFAQKTMMLDVLNGTIQTANFTAEYFDTITLWDVIEHVVDPRATLDEARRILKKGGLLAISTPNVNGITASLSKKTWLYYTPPEHLYFFNRNALSTLFKESGFIIKRIRTRNIYFNNILQSFKYRHKLTREAQRTSIANISSKIERNKMLTLMARLVNLLVYQSVWGDILFAYGIKL